MYRCVYKQQNASESCGMFVEGGVSQVVRPEPKRGKDPGADNRQREGQHFAPLERQGIWDYKYGKKRTCAYEDLNAAVLRCPFTQYSHIWLLDSRESRLAFDELRLR